MKKILKITGITVLIIIAVPLIVALFIKQEYAVEREVIIEKPIHEVFDYLVLLKNQGNFSVWSKMDPEMKQEFTGTDGTVGFISAWDSENKDVGRGEQEIMKITQGERIDYELRFFEPFEATDFAYMTTEPVSENQTRVKWGFNGKMSYPMNLFMLTMDMGKMLGGDLETGLANLKSILDNRSGHGDEI